MAGYVAMVVMGVDLASRRDPVSDQQKKLREVVQHAIAHSPYYREVLGAVAPGEVSLETLPILTKQTLMKQFDRLVTDRRLSLARAEDHLKSEQAGEALFDEFRIFAAEGTTGRRALGVYDQSAWQIARGALHWVLNLQGIPAFARVMGIGSPSPLHMTNRLFAELRDSRAEIPRLAVTTPMPEVASALNAYQPEVVVTYPSFIRRLAEEQRKGRLRIRPRAFCATAEMLTQDVRDLARSAWDANVLSLYGATEVNILGAECPIARGLHVPEHLVMVEVVDAKYRRVAPGVAGHKVLVTTLYNYLLPLIRYEITDRVVAASGPCACGLKGLRLTSLEGRREEVPRSPRLPASVGRGQSTGLGLRSQMSRAYS